MIPPKNNVWGIILDVCAYSLSKITIIYDQVNEFCSKIISHFPATITNNHTVAHLISVIGTARGNQLSRTLVIGPLEIL
jgi:hypothetical protein